MAVSEAKFLMLVKKKQYVEVLDDKRSIEMIPLMALVRGQGICNWRALRRAKTHNFYDYYGIVR